MTTEPEKHPEELAREVIDEALEEADWVIQDRADMNVAAGLGVAIRELKTNAGFADYLLYVDKKAAGVIEAKKVGAARRILPASSRRWPAAWSTPRGVAMREENA